MTDVIAQEIDRLRAILGSVAMPFEPTAGASAERIAAVERQTGITFDADLRAFWRAVNGDHLGCLAVMTDELTPCHPMSLADGTTEWASFEPYTATDAGLWADDVGRDPRIRPGVTRHRGWFPIAEFNGCSTVVFYDADPATGGRAGQVIAYQHDPDAVYYVADTFAAFLTLSNDLLAADLTELMFAEDEYERICHMTGTGELARQLAAALDPTQPNWERLDLRAKATRAGRADLVAYLDQHRPA